MADKQSIGALGTDQDQGAVTTAGTTTLGTVKILWDDANTSSDVMDALDRAKQQVMKYYALRG